MSLLELSDHSGDRDGAALANGAAPVEFETTLGVAPRPELDRQLAVETRRALRTGGAVSLLLIDAGDARPAAGAAALLDVSRLREAAAVLRDHVREYDLAAYYALGQLAVLLPDTDLPTARLVAERLMRLIRAALSGASAVSLPDEPAEPRLGFSSFPRPAGDVQTLIAQAEEALASARRAGEPIVGHVGGGVLAAREEESESPSVDEAAALLARAIQARERERARIARELHDGPAQTLANVLSVTEMATAVIRTQPEVAEELLAGLREHVSHTLDEVRRISRNLRPEMLDHLGLVPAVRRLVADAASNGELAVTFSVTGEERRLEPVLELGAFRVVQEALTNCRRHAGARRAQVSLHYAPDHLLVRVGDDGCGFPASELARLASSGHHGLVHMRERTWHLGGTFTIRSAPGKGTVVLARIPVRSVSEE